MSPIRKPTMQRRPMRSGRPCRTSCRTRSRGEFLGGGGFLSLATEGAVVRRAYGETRVIDGPYVETKELIGGFAMLEYTSRAAAIDGARRFLEVAGDGECTTYPIM
jgi:hypothetical protein